MKAVRQIRAAVSLLDPHKVRENSDTPPSIGILANGAAAYGEIEDLLLPPGMPHADRVRLIASIHPSETESAGPYDLVICHGDSPCPSGAFAFDPAEPEAVIPEILRARADLSLRLARHFPRFRGPVVDHIVHTVASENALFAIATSLPNVIPTFIELPWSLGEFASDTAFLTFNQVRMAYLVAAACGKEVGLKHQKAEIVSIVGGAFGWRAIARELAGKIPLGGGIIPKGAIAYAGTFVVGKGLEHFYHARAHHSRAERKRIYRQAFQRGKSVVQSLTSDAGR
jgi:uncharacterized protein (DUF697 family)